MKTLDAKNRSLGRVATEVAMALMGKDSPHYQPNSIPNEEVHIINAAQMKITEKKLNEKTYIKHTGYPGSQTFTPMKKILEKKGYEELIKKAVKGMLPPNKLRSKMLMNIKVTD